MGSKQQLFKSTIENSVSQFWEDMDSIKSDLDDTIDGMSERLSGTNRYTVLEEARDAFEEHTGDAPDVPKFLSDVKVEYFNDTRTRESQTYSVRRDNMVNMLQAAIDGIKNMTEGHGDEITSEQVQEAEDLVDELEDVITEIEGISFD